VEANNRRASLWKTLAVAMALLGALTVFAAAHSSRAEAEANEVFCPGASVGPYGQSNDWCAGGGRHGIVFVQVQAVEHSACASTTTNGAKSGTNVSWVCTSGGGNEVTQNWGPNFQNCAYGILRNNTTGASNRVTGVVSYNTEKAC
jgi:hypothetical protein